MIPVRQHSGAWILSTSCRTLWCCTKKINKNRLIWFRWSTYIRAVFIHSDFIWLSKMIWVHPKMFSVTRIKDSLVKLNKQIHGHFEHLIPNMYRSANDKSMPNTRLDPNRSQFTRLTIKLTPNRCAHGQTMWNSLFHFFFNI